MSNKILLLIVATAREFYVRGDPIHLLDAGHVPKDRSIGLHDAGHVQPLFLKAQKQHTYTKDSTRQFERPNKSITVSYWVSFLLGSGVWF